MKIKKIVALFLASVLLTACFGGASVWETPETPAANDLVVTNELDYTSVVTELTYPMLLNSTTNELDRLSAEAEIAYSMLQNSIVYELDRINVATGLTHSMLLNSDGSLWIWGENTFGQLGTGEFTKYAYGMNNVIAENHDAHIPFRLMDGIIDIAAGDGFSLALNEDGELYSWGLNDRGQLGDGSTITRVTPKKILDNVAFIDARSSVAIAILNDGSLWTWGRNVNEITQDYDFSSPTHVMDNVKTAAADSFNILMVTNDNRLYGIGSASSLGIGDRGPNTFMDTPTFVLPNIRDIAADGRTSFAVTLDDRLYAWGANGFSGSVGSGSDDFWISSPEFVVDNVQTVLPGNMLIKNDNSLWIWGSIYGSFDVRFQSTDGQSMNGGGSMMELIVEYGNRPVKLMENVLTASGGSGGNGNHFLAVDRDLNLFAWGENQFGELGTGRANIYGFEELETMPGFYDFFPYLIYSSREAYPVFVKNLDLTEMP